MTMETALQYIDSIDKEARAFRAGIFKQMWYMRGSVTVDEAFMLTHEDREIISEIVNDNLETTKKTGLSFF